MEAFDRADQKAMLIICESSEDAAEKYIVAASGVAGHGDNNEIQTVLRFSSRIFIAGDQKTAAQPGVGLDGAQGGNRSPSPGQHCFEYFLGKKDSPETPRIPQCSMEIYLFQTDVLHPCMHAFKKLFSAVGLGVCTPESGLRIPQSF